MKDDWQKELQRGLPCSSGGVLPRSSKNCPVEFSCIGQELSSSSTTIMLRHWLEAVVRKHSLGRNATVELRKHRFNYVPHGKVSHRESWAVNLRVVRASNWN